MRWIAESGGMISDLSVSEGRSRYLELEERELLMVWREQGITQAEIARRLGRAASTIGRELDRNQTRRAKRRPPRPDGQRHRPGTGAQTGAGIGPRTSGCAIRPR